MDYKKFRQVKAIEASNKKKLLKVNPNGNPRVRRTVERNINQASTTYDWIRATY